MGHVAAVLPELAERIRPGRLGAGSESFERSVAQRLGYLLTRAGRGDLTGPLFRRLASAGPAPWVGLDPAEGGDSGRPRPPAKRDSRSRVIVRRAPEGFLMKARPWPSSPGAPPRRGRSSGRWSRT